MSSAFNPGYIIALYINTKLSWNFESEKKNPLEIQIFYRMLTSQPNKSVRNEQIRMSLRYHQIGAINVAHFSANFNQLYIKMQE